MDDGTPELTVIVPMLDEEGNVGPLAGRLARSLEAACPDYELLFVDDGSTDGSVERVRRLAAESPRVRLVALARNFGKEAAILAGYDHARGRTVVVLDADLQQPPELVPELLALWRRGYDVVNAVLDWSFGDDAVKATWSTDGKSKNVAQGFFAAHVFASPGTFVVTLRVTDKLGNVSLPVTTTISVADPAVVYAGRTWCISSTVSPGFDGCPITDRRSTS